LRRTSFLNRAPTHSIIILVFYVLRFDFTGYYGSQVGPVKGGGMAVAKLELEQMGTTLNLKLTLKNMKITNIKKWTTALACAVCVGFASQATAVPTPLSLNAQLGNVVPGTPANELEERSYVNSLVARANGVSSAPYDQGGHAYTLVNNPAAVLPFVGTAADATTYSKANSSAGTFDVTGFRYLLVKLGQDSYVWDLTGYSGEITLTDIPTSGGFGISHHSLFKAGTTPPDNNLPEGGTTVVLLGFALCGLGLVRARLINA
jgi:hypothetical protein